MLLCKHVSKLVRYKGYDLIKQVVVLFFEKITQYVNKFV